MIDRRCVIVWIILLVVGSGSGFIAGQDPIAAKSAPVSFMKQIAPILKENCLSCHNARDQKGKLDMTSFATLAKGGERGDAVVAKKPEESLLFTLISGADDPRMPPEDVSKPLPTGEVALIEQWIKEGAHFDGVSRDEPILAALRRAWQPPMPPSHYAHPQPILALLFTPDGRHLLAGGYHEILLFDLGSDLGKKNVVPALVGRVRVRPERCHAMIWIEEGKTLAVAGGRAGQEGNVILLQFDLSQWMTQPLTIQDGVHPDAGLFVRELLQTDDVMLCLAFHAQEQWLAAGGADRKVHLWKWPDAKEESPSDIVHADWVQSLAFTPDGKRLISTSRDKTAKSWNLADLTLLHTFRDHLATVHACLPRPDQKSVVTVGEDSPLRLWTIDGSNRQTRIFPGHSKPVYQIQAIPQANLLATGSGDHSIRLWNAENGRATRTLTGLNDAVYALAVSPDGQWLVGGSRLGEVALWKVQDRASTPVTKFKAYPAPATSP